MKKIEIYTSPLCGFAMLPNGCSTAKALLTLNTTS